MIYKMMSVYDQKAEAYMRPFFARSTGEAIRSFTDEVNAGKQDYSICNHPEDFVLFELGTWDEMSGVALVEDKPKSIVSGIDVKRVEHRLSEAKAI